MSFISLPHEFEKETGIPRSYQIAMQNEGDLTPIGFLRGEKTLPVDLRKLAENFAAMLNGNNPLYRLGDAHHMFYEQHPGGMNFRFRTGEGMGVSTLGAMLTLMPGIEMEFDDGH